MYDTLTASAPGVGLLCVKDVGNDGSVGDPRGGGVLLLIARRNEFVHGFEGAQQVDMGHAGTFLVVAGLYMRAGENGGDPVPVLRLSGGRVCQSWSTHPLAGRKGPECIPSAGH